MKEEFPKQEPKEKKEKPDSWLESLNVRELFEGLMAAEESEKEGRKAQRKVDIEKEEMLSRIKAAGGMAKFQKMVEEEMRRAGGETELDRARAIKSVMEKLIQAK